MVALFNSRDSQAGRRNRLLFLKSVKMKRTRGFKYFELIISSWLGDILIINAHLVNFFLKFLSNFIEMYYYLFILPFPVKLNIVIVAIADTVIVIVLAAADIIIAIVVADTVIAIAVVVVVAAIVDTVIPIVAIVAPVVAIADTVVIVIVLVIVVAKAIL